ncbi:MAG: hypothetical protein ACLSG8_04915 [Barnesiella sp.]
MKRCLSFFFFFFPALAISQNDDMKMISQKDASELWTATWFEAPIIEPEEDGDAETDTVQRLIRSVIKEQISNGFIFVFRPSLKLQVICWVR